jgi:hypothetical protein
MKKVKVITQERGNTAEFEHKIEDFINGKHVYDVKYSITYDNGYDDYVYSALILYDD